MFRHLFKLIWNKKKQNALLITEMFISFIVMFAVFTLIVYSYKNYKQPMNFDYKDVWVINFTQTIPNNVSIATLQNTLKQSMLAMGSIKEISYCTNNLPFSMSSSNSMINYGRNKRVITNFYNTEETYRDILNINMAEGRWFNKTDKVSRHKAVVINKKLKEELFGSESAVGKILGEPDPAKASSANSFIVTGVMENIKDEGDYHAVENGMYEQMDSGWIRHAGNMLIKVKPGTDAAFESRLFKTLSSGLLTNVEIEHMDKKLVTKNKIMLIPTIIALIVAGFLIINVALGLFGVLWYNINKRKGEIGLRRAVGASGNSISWQLVSEALVLSTLSLILGLFFAMQFPLLNVFELPGNVYIAAIVMAVVFIYLLVTICALYPGKQAAAIYPAVALHED